MVFIPIINKKDAMCDLASGDVTQEMFFGSRIK